jgi:arginine decarboxylase
MSQRLLDFPVVIIDSDYDSPRINGVLIRALADEIRANGMRVLTGLNIADAHAGARSYIAASAVLISIDSSEAGSNPFDKILKLVQHEAPRLADLPLFLYGERKTAQKAPLELVRHLAGYLYLYDDTKSFLARQVVRAADRYQDDMCPPFFKALVTHCKESNYSWHTPGHGGGVAFTKSPVGRALHQFFGENTLRSDLSVSVPELGSLLDHTGPIREAEAEAAENFGADYTFFVTNGTSTANKIVWNGMVTTGDIVFVDRNCHKSLLHSLIITGATPVYFHPSRNAHGIIGPISLEQFGAESMRKAIADSPLASKIKGGVKLAVVTNSTYDGLCYKATTILDQVDKTVAGMHFDEAWYCHAPFHKFYEGHYAMAKGQERPKGPLVFATHSTHKLLAAFSQASMIHVKNSQTRELDFVRFNDSFMIHTSTSPHYGVIASLDVASRMMAGEAGQALIQGVHDEAMQFRRAMLNVSDTLKDGDWWFRVWQPDAVTKALRDGVDGGVLGKARTWTLQPGDSWHGFEGLAKNFVLIDPIKVTLMTPGLTIDGKMESDGIPAAVVSKYLWSRGIVVEKTGLYSFLVLFTLGITKGKWSTFITELLQFKRYYDEDAPLEHAIPSLTAAEAKAYAGKGLRQVCSELHAFYKANKVPEIMKAMYTDVPEIVMRPRDAYEGLVRGDVEEVEVEALSGRIAAVMLVPYPPGIPLIMPGERFGDASGALLEYLRVAPTQDAKFPGFSVEVHGLIPRETAKGKRFIVDVLKKK